jgi:hypothetical protein
MQAVDRVPAIGELRPRQNALMQGYDTGMRNCKIGMRTERGWSM